MGAQVQRLVITEDGNYDFAFDPGGSDIKTVCHISGTISIEYQYGDGLLDDSPNFVASTNITGETASFTDAIKAVPSIRVVASGTSGGTATVMFVQEGEEYNIEGHFEQGQQEYAQCMFTAETLKAKYSMRIEICQIDQGR